LCFDHVAGFIVSTITASCERLVELRVADCIIDFQVPQAAEWQSIGSQIGAAFIFDLVRVACAEAAFTIPGAFQREQDKFVDVFVMFRTL
jgi:hypothetical protein